MKQLINTKRLLRLIIFSIVLVLLASSIIQAEGIDLGYVEKVIPNQPTGGDYTLLASTTVGGSMSNGGDYLSNSIIGEGYGAKLGGGDYIMYTGFQPSIISSSADRLYFPLIMKN